MSSREYWLNDGYGHAVLHDRTKLSRRDEYPWHEAYGGECPGVYYIRLQRDGWAMKYTAPDGEGGQVSLFEKPAGGHWRLRKRAYATLSHPVGRGSYFDRHELFNARTEEVLPRPDWEWADVDGKRLVWTQDGTLYAGRLHARGPGEERALHDFNAMAFERREAPYD
jgi:hypothetical protein